MRRNDNLWKSWATPGDRRETRGQKTYGGTGEEPGILWSVIHSKWTHLPQIWCGSHDSEAQGPLWPRRAPFNAFINHINWVIAEFWVHRPMSLSCLIHDTSRTHNSANKITEQREMVSLICLRELWALASICILLSSGFQMQAHFLQGLCEEKMRSQRINTAY